jgi:hypothetical protein
LPLGSASWAVTEERADLGVLREAPSFLLREDHLSVLEHVELALVALFEVGLVLGLGVQLGRETRGPFVVAVSDWAVEDANPRHGENLPPRAHSAGVPWALHLP